MATAGSMASPTQKDAILDFVCTCVYLYFLKVLLALLWKKRRGRGPRSPLRLRTPD
jgi:hypothetical protein